MRAYRCDFCGADSESMYSEDVNFKDRDVHITVYSWLKGESSADSHFCPSCILAMLHNIFTKKIETASPPKE